jgi:hypothetical protein
MPLMRRRPLLRAAAVGGGAYAAGRHSANSRAREEEQEARLAQLEAQQGAPAQAPAPAAGMSQQVLDQLQTLGQLREQGVLTDAEFEQQKQRLLAG